MEKSCSKCGLTKDISEFAFQNKAKNEYSSWCKKCHAEKEKKYYQLNREECLKKRDEYYLKNKEKILEQSKVYYQDNSEKIKARVKQYRDKTGYAKKYYYDNIEKIQQYREDNADKIHNYHKEYCKKYPEKLLVKHNRRRARELGFEDSGLTKEEYRTVLERFDFRCFNCGKTRHETKLTIDHNKPLVNGNKMTLSNAVLLCKVCNAKKGIKEPEEFYVSEKLENLDKILGGSYSKA